MNTEMKKTVVYSTGDKILNIMKRAGYGYSRTFFAVRCQGRCIDGYSGRYPGSRYKYALQNCRPDWRFVYGSFALMKKAMSFRWKKISLQSSL